MPADATWMTAALAIYVTAALAAIAAAIGRRSFTPAIALLGTALAGHTVALIARWNRLDHGPYVDMYEILSSNVWSLHLILLIACLVIRQIRPVLATALPVLQVLVIWHLLVPASSPMVPVTYDTIWLPVHVVVGKLFLGCIVVAVGLSLVVLLRRTAAGGMFDAMPGNEALDELIYRFVVVGFVSQCLLLVVGAVWARDAWGRYWAWDPLETWAFITWLAVVGYLHARVTWRVRPAVGGALVLLVYGLAFFTFFGVPFVSQAPHKGAI